MFFIISQQLKKIKLYSRKNINKISRIILIYRINNQIKVIIQLTNQTPKLKILKQVIME